MSLPIKIRIASFLRNMIMSIDESDRESEARKCAVMCPICKSGHDRFSPFSKHSNECTYCHSLERHRLLWMYLRAKTNFFTQKKIRVLHFAPEKALYDKFSHDARIIYYPSDIAMEKFQQKGMHRVGRVDITNIPFPDGYFDVILCSHVLEHIPDDQRAMSELRRVMKDTGWGIFQVPMHGVYRKTYEDFTIVEPRLRTKAFGQSDHVRWYGRDYKDRLSKAGFRVHVDAYARSLPSKEIAQFGLNKWEDIYFCEVAEAK